MTSSNPKVAVVGCGYWGKNLVRNFAALGALKWVCDPSEDALSRAAAHPGVLQTTRLEDVLEDPETRGVVVSAPAAMHASIALAAIAAGKDVFVEKPLAMSFADGVEVVRAAEGAKVILMAGHIFVHHPAVVALKELVARGDLGRILYVYSNRLNLGRVRQEENILYSFAPHDISVIESVLQAEPVSVSTFGGNYLQERIADVTVTNMEFPGGVKGHIFVSWLHPFREKKLVVVGDEKMAVFDDMAREGKLKLYDKGIDWEAGLPVPRSSGETTLYFEEAEPMRLECKHFLACIRDRKQPLTDGRSALAVLKVLEASQRSLECSGEPVRPADIESEVTA